ncbi:outer membrane lipoprotein SlyB [Actimicrobium sp. GrIS 1.19]|uniref:glycine zipper 2TM domain-containing protein n=1 Tax=Actimicrobium sp. GrIS 1.19 TaxID=3071708 RepID=UPI002E0AAB1F|nr:outer membrane lipoprotein SlyB [Actimicrobium sp. GrIS 1.19]
MKITSTLAASALIASTLLAGCATPYQQQPNVQSYPAANTQGYNTQYGVIDSIQSTRAPNNSGPGMGAVVGGVVGGLLGNQVGGGSGRAVATAAGVVGGAVVGNNLEKNNQAPGRELYQIGVRLDNGSFETINEENIGDLRVGNRVRIENGRVYRY